MNGADAMLAKSAVWAKPSCNICPVNGRILNNGKKNDGLHFGVKGYELLAKLIVQKLNQISN